MTGIPIAMSFVDEVCFLKIVFLFSTLDLTNAGITESTYYTEIKT